MTPYSIQTAETGTKYLSASVNPTSGCLAIDVAGGGEYLWAQR